MNIKLHTPKSLKAGSGMASLKQFLLSLFATSVSIALTFGTAAIIDYKSKQNAKREIVMIVMYDMYNSLELIEKADSNIRQSMELQRQIAEDTTLYNKKRFMFGYLLPIADFTETTERIFSSSIESINTVGNVLFTENVAKFYQNRRDYKSMVCDSVRNRVSREIPFTTLKGTLEYDYTFEAIASGDILEELRCLFTQCKQMMDVSDEDIEAYRQEREQMEKGMFDKKTEQDSTMSEVIQLRGAIDNAVKKLKLE